MRPPIPSPSHSRPPPASGTPPASARSRRARHSLAHRLSLSVSRFLHIEAAGGLVLLAASALALAWANSPWSASYAALWHTPITLSAGSAGFARTIGFWVDEGLMTLFFFVVGLEIRGELAHGALSSVRAALLPVVAALGGMLAPALIFLAIDHSAALRRGWAVPTATDIAFAVGILALLGRRVPRPLRAFLLALAIIDDIGAIVIIAVFYSHGVSWPGLALAAGAALAVPALGRASKRGMALLYAAAGLVIWAGLLWGGVHPTLAGVILGLLIPASPPAGAASDTLPMCTRLEHALHPWVAYGVMPVFALANAGIDFRSLALGAAEPRWLVAGVVVALTVGKPLGIVLGTLVCSGLRLGALPRGMGHGGLLLVGCLGGIGFTMSLFIARLAFESEPLLGAAKLGILAGSALSAVFGLAVGRALFGGRGAAA